MDRIKQNNMCIIKACEKWLTHSCSSIGYKKYQFFKKKYVSQANKIENTAYELKLVRKKNISKKGALITNTEIKKIQRSEINTLILQLNILEKGWATPKIKKWRNQHDKAIKSEIEMIEPIERNKKRMITFEKINKIGKLLCRVIIQEKTQINKIRNERCLRSDSTKMQRFIWDFLKK